MNKDQAWDSYINSDGYADQRGSVNIGQEKRDYFIKKYGKSNYLEIELFARELAEETEEHGFKVGYDYPKPA